MPSPEKQVRGLSTRCAHRRRLHHRDCRPYLCVDELLCSRRRDALVGPERRSARRSGIPHRRARQLGNHRSDLLRGPYYGFRNGPGIQVQDAATRTGISKWSAGRGRARQNQSIACHTERDRSIAGRPRWTTGSIAYELFNQSTRALTCTAKSLGLARPSLVVDTGDQAVLIEQRPARHALRKLLCHLNHRHRALRGQRAYR